MLLSLSAHIRLPLQQSVSDIFRDRDNVKCSKPESRYICWPTQLVQEWPNLYSSPFYLSTSVLNYSLFLWWTEILVSKAKRSLQRYSRVLGSCQNISIMESAEFRPKFQDPLFRTYSHTVFYLSLVLQSNISSWGMASSGILRRVALVRTDVSGNLAPPSEHLVFLRSMHWLIVTASVFLTSPVVVTLMKDMLSSSETSVPTRATRRNNPEYTILYRDWLWT
jgi:hypothetical protein